MVNKAKDILHKMNIHENVGLIVSGDQFIAQEGQVSKIKKDFPNISLGTVYRNLNQLAEAGLIRKVEGLDGSVHFDHNTHNHYHFVCIKCNKVYDVPCEVAPDLDQKVLVKTGLQVISHDITFKGICQHCQKHN